MNGRCWCVVPAAGRGTRFGSELLKQFLEVGGRSVLQHTLDALLVHPRVAGAMVALPRDGLQMAARLQAPEGKPVLACIGGADRAESVANALAALPADVREDAPVLVHDAARANLSQGDLDALFAALDADPRGAILAAPVRDTLKRADATGRILATEPRDALWRAFTPQAFPRRALAEALGDAARHGIAVTDEAMAMERVGVRARLVEGREDNFKITTPADLARFAYLVAQR